MKINYQISSKGLYYLDNGKLKEFSFDSAKTILCGVPGAFTPGCVNHLRGFAESVDDIFLKRVEKIVFVSINDAYVMSAWNKLCGHKDITCVSDPIGTFTKSLAQEKNWGDSFGIRSKRYAVLVENHKIIHIFSDPFHKAVLNEL